jgi:hypothetical protein
MLWFHNSWILMILHSLQSESWVIINKPFFGQYLCRLQTSFSQTWVNIQPDFYQHSTKTPTNIQHSKHSSSLWVHRSNFQVSFISKISKLHVFSRKISNSQASRTEKLFFRINFRALFLLCTNFYVFSWRFLLGDKKWMVQTNESKLFLMIQQIFFVNHTPIIMVYFALLLEENDFLEVILTKLRWRNDARLDNWRMVGIERQNEWKTHGEMIEFDCLLQSLGIEEDQQIVEHLLWTAGSQTTGRWITGSRTLGS